MDVGGLPVIQSIISSIDVIDRLEEQRYEQQNGIILKDFFEVGYGKDNYNVSLILCRVNYTDDMYRTKMTFTKMIKELENKCISPTYEMVLVDVIYKTLDYMYKFGKIKNHSCWIFPKPVQLHAQSSANRSGYGNVVLNGEIVHQGTLYGETTVYGIKGAIFDKVKK